MTLRIVGGDARETLPHVYGKTPASMRELLAKSVEQLSRELNFKSILDYDYGDSHARAAEHSNRTASVFFTEAAFIQNTIADINDAIFRITAVDGELTHLYSLCQSAMDGSKPDMNHSEEIRLTLNRLNAVNEQTFNSKVISLFSMEESNKTYPEWNSEALQLDKIDISTPSAAEASLNLISSAISVLAYSKHRAEQALANKRQIIREISVARENKSAAVSVIPKRESYTGENHILCGSQNLDAAACYSGIRGILSGDRPYE